MHAGMQHLVRDLNGLYRGTAPLHQLDCAPEGFEWIDCQDVENSIVSYIRRARDPEDFVVIVCNWTPMPRTNYRIGVQRGGFYRERLNTDASEDRKSTRLNYSH